MSKSIVIDIKGNPWLKDSGEGATEGVFTTYVKIPFDLDKIIKIKLHDRSGFELIYNDGTRSKSIGFLPSENAPAERAELSMDLIFKLIESKK